MAANKHNNQHLLKITGVFIIGIIIGALIYGFLLVPKVKAPTSQNPKSTGLNIINLSATGDEKLDLYFRSQIEAPATYYVTDDQMLEDYNSMGGMAPPRLILMKNYQLIPDTSAGQNYLDKILSNNKNDCITIWSTGGFSSVNDWSRLISQVDNNSTWEMGGVLENISVGDKSAEIYKVKKGDGSFYAGYLPVTTDLSGVSYFFMTCNENNKLDLIDVIKSIKFRKALS